MNIHHILSVSHFLLRRVFSKRRFASFLPAVILGLWATTFITEAAPNLVLIAPGFAYVDEVVLVDGRQSLGVSKMPQPNGVPSVTIDFGDGFTANLLASGHVYRAPGTYTITLTANDISGAAAVTQRPIVVSAVPSATVSTIQLLSDTGNANTNATNLQSAINLAAMSNSSEQEIVLPAGAVFAGPIVLPAPVGDRYITIRSGSLSSLPASGNRVGPNQGSLMPTITAPSSTSATLGAMWTTNPAPAVPPHHYRIQGIHFRKNDETKYSQVLLGIGDFNAVQNRLTMLPHHFIVERCWFDGGASDTSQTNSGVRIAADYVSVVDSYSGEFRLIGSGVDTAAIAIGKGRGPYAFVNNTLIAGSENFFVGGQAAEINRAAISNATTSSATLANVSNLEVDQNIALPVGGIYGPGQSTIVRSI
ncbi:MAG TPA: PKD domain-containing protein, partial [Pyrinomonadaceae bacterium]|nr:PKD domain-containing protein [Pyrinomonadaceae bacterium]